MMRAVAVAGLLLLLPFEAWAQEACKEPPGFIAGGTPVVFPAGFSAGATVAARKPDKSLGEAIKPAGTWDPLQVSNLRSAAGGDSGELVWTQGASSCAHTVSLTAPPVNKPEESTTPRVDAVECQSAGQKWLSTLGSPEPGRSVTALLFREDGGLCFDSNLRPTQGDTIYVGVYTSDATKWSQARITFQPCSLESASPKVLVTDRLPTILTKTQALVFEIKQFPQRQCFDPIVNIIVENGGGTQQLTHTLHQATRYRATLHLGTVFTENHETTFGLRPAGEDTQRVFAEGPVDKGPEYVAALVFYSLLRYIPPLGGRASYQGRDPVRDNGFADKLGGVIGVGLRNPLKRFVTGFSFEVAAGVNVLAVWDWAEANVLTGGIREGDLFPSDDETLIPTQKEWRQKFVFGVSMDLVYASNAFKR